ncbi:uncharacterized protein PFL1_05906 [Pseudozyma flocculosa PF-1]|uniref:Protein kinase domain-containing protein n=2 Tax=Pseudozyma flocculosa TaxID=84751 RepID=A0A061H3V3_9BASI|nr:uncharacterized protein PFL1_05906 [Pseudozyma flocculosa PF-1]EPQ26585.1 hypothetical protein PFL1_05906 [Pseudozyma flocculosa PF-1]SPO38421.1 related to SCY1 - putative kinase [Pseudozyma flocculosa]
MASFLSQASSYFGRTNISVNYTIDEAQTPAHCGLWKIYKATRNASSSSTTSTSAPAGRGTVSIWVHSLNTRGQARARVLDQLKKEASSLTRLRHPCILEVVEPLEESRNEVTFATEQVFATLQEALVADHRADVQLDEVEIQKGLLQIARGLEFLHFGAKMVHQNLTPDSILINAKGDWKIAGFSFLTTLTAPDGTPTPWSFPDSDPSLPPALSRNLDFLAPEYALDEKEPQPANDMYSLGCVVYAVHNRGNPPFRNRSVTNLRQNADQLSVAVGSASWQRMGKDVLDLLGSLLTRYPGARLNAQTFQQASYFNSILVSTLKFMERENFAGRTKEERVQYLKGLLKILPQFSDRLLRRKVLPAVLELMSDRSLLPYILPNAFYISKSLSSIEFTGSVLPKLKPLFQVQDPPQNMLILLDQIELFVQKTSPSVFREEVTPLLYASLEAENVMVQEKALNTVPRLAEILEYAHVKEVLFPKLAVLFAKTKVLSVKVNTLICFHSMVAILDKYTLTEKLVPILARIKTKEPSVMIATLAVHEAMSKKVDRETLATAIIPQLWIMSMGPLLNAEQFARFMKAVQEMGARVCEEHTKHLREVKSAVEHTDSFVGARQNGGGGGLSGGVTGIGAGGEIDFATLVGNAKTAAGASKEVSRDSAAADPFGFDDSPFGGASAASTPVQASTPALTPSHTGAGSGFRPSKPALPASINRASNNSSPFVGGSLKSSTSTGTLPSLAPPPPPASSSTRPMLSSNLSSSTSVSSKPASAGWNDILQPASSSSGAKPATTSAMTPASTSTTANGGGAGPNYNISLPPATNWSNNAAFTSAGNGNGSSGSSSMMTPMFAQAKAIEPTPSTGFGAMGSSLTPSAAPALAPSPAASVMASSGPAAPPGWEGAVLQPSTSKGSGGKAGGGIHNGGGGGGADAWKDFDPFG